MSMLLQEGSINKLVLKNRIVMAPMCMYASDNKGHIKDFHDIHYTSRAIGGVGLIIVEATAVEPKGRISNKDLGLWRDEHIKEHKLLVKKCHQFGAKVAIQLAHAGRKSIVESSTPIAPSAIAFSNELPFKIPTKMTSKEIEGIKKLFLDAAKRAKKAKYDALELHAAHGYLLCEFLSPLTNRRKDAYGGTLENRSLLVLEIAKLIKKTTNLPLIVRLSATEYMKDGWSLSDSIYLSKELEKVGVDAIHVSSGGNQETVDDMPQLEPLYQCNFANQIKKHLTIPVIAVGLITKVSDAEKVLNEHSADFVALGRELLRAPNFAFAAAKELHEKECIISSYLRAY